MLPTRRGMEPCVEVGNVFVKKEWRAADHAAVSGFRALWDKIYGESEFAWEASPWVWVIRFKAALGDEKAY